MYRKRIGWSQIIIPTKKVLRLRRQNQGIHQKKGTLAHYHEHGYFGPGTPRPLKLVVPFLATPIRQFFKILEKFV